MAKKQTRRSISVSRSTYERLKAFCETNNISMSQFVETRVGDFLGEGAATGTTSIIPTQPKPTASVPVKPSSMPSSPAKPEPRSAVAASAPSSSSSVASTTSVSSAGVVPMTSAAARYAVEPPPPIIKPRQEQAAPKPAEKKPEQIFTF